MSTMIFHFPSLQPCGWIWNLVLRVLCFRFLFSFSFRISATPHTTDNSTEYRPVGVMADGLFDVCHYAPMTEIEACPEYLTMKSDLFGLFVTMTINWMNFYYYYYHYLRSYSQWFQNWREKTKTFFLSEQLEFIINNHHLFIFCKKKTKMNDERPNGNKFGMI